MVDRFYCQSCGMPLEQEKDFGTNKDSSQNQEYCCYCFQKGEFTDPDISLEDMIEKVSSIMHQKEMPKELIAQVKVIIPTLKRWGGKTQGVKS